MARKTKAEKRAEELEAALRDLLDATRFYIHMPEGARRRALDVLHK